jgi:hypothetical protein
MPIYVFRTLVEFILFLLCPPSEACLSPNSYSLFRAMKSRCLEIFVQPLTKNFLMKTEKYVDEQSKREIKETLVQFDRSLLVMDPRRYAIMKDKVLEPV